MVCGDMRSAKVMMDMRVEEAQREARSRMVEYQTCAGWWEWVQRRACRMFSSLGNRLVIVGRRLERRSLPKQSL